MEKLKIGILGNMNNNGFCLLRYFRDLGLDADLLLFQDDQTGHSSHFSIKADTWNYSKWGKYIKHLPAVNGYGQAISHRFINKLILYILYFFRKVLESPNAIFTKPPRKKEVKELIFILDKYDVFIGSGATPAIFDSLGMRLDLFFPYSMGIENVNENFFNKYRTSRNPLIRYLANQMYQMQVKGIRNAKTIINTDFLGSTTEAFREIDVKPKNIPVPFVYPFEKVNKNKFSKNLRFALQKINENDFVIVCHSRHQWICPKNFIKKEWKDVSKNNDWLIKSYREFLRLRPNANSLLILFEYGENYLQSKQLCEKLKIESKIIWIPCMDRKEILQIIKCSSVGVGEFYDKNIIWGGTAWEIISQGCPLIQGLRINSDEFLKLSGYPLPPLFPVKSKENITEHLLTLYDNKLLRNNIKPQSQDWFNKYNGYVAAKDIYDLIK